MAVKGIIVNEENEQAVQHITETAVKVALLYL